MRRYGIFSAVAALAVAFAAGSVCAQTAATAPVGKPLALLAGLRPPHEAKHKQPRHIVRAKVEKTSARTRHARMAAVHARHVAAKKLAKREYEHHERAVTASAFADEPPAQATANPPPASQPNWPAVNTANDAAVPVTAPAEPAISEKAPPNVDANVEPPAAQVATVKITPPSQDAVSNPAAANAASAAPAPSIYHEAAPQSQTLLAASAQEQKTKTTDPVGSASWIAQVLAAFGGAVTAGAVAWFLIGGGPVRTYG